MITKLEIFLSQFLVYSMTTFFCNNNLVFCVYVWNLYLLSDQIIWGVSFIELLLFIVLIFSCGTTRGWTVVSFAVAWGVVWTRGAILIGLSSVLRWIGSGIIDSSDLIDQIRMELRHWANFACIRAAGLALQVELRCSHDEWAWLQLMTTWLELS